MNRMKCMIVAGIALVAFRAVADPGDPVVLYQPQEIVGKRMMGDVQPFATFILQAQEAWSNALPGTSARSQTAMVVAIGSNREPCGWIVGGTADTNRNARFVTLLRKHTPPPMQEGIVAFAITGSRFETQSVEPSSFSPPVPQEWRDAMKQAKGPETIDQLLERMMPENNQKAPNNTSDGIRQPADGSPKPSK